MASQGTGDAGEERSRASVVRPEHFEDVAEVVPVLTAMRPVVLELDRLDDAQRRRALDFVTGVAYALDTSFSGVTETKHLFLLEPGTGRRHHQEPLRSAPPSNPNDAPKRDQRSSSDPPLCVLCDLRPADKAFRSPLDMVIRRDGSRMWSPPAAVCSHCRATIRHWRFTLAWCPECERWGRRSVESPCGALYG